VIVADPMRNTGRFNIAQGAIITAQSNGAALSTALTGSIVVKAGYSAAFLVLGAVAALGFSIYWLALPETCAYVDTVRAGQTGPSVSAIAAE
jgi:hypothetical protein